MKYQYYFDVVLRGERLAIAEKANEIITLYAGQGYTLSLRQLYYQFVARDLIENKDQSYKRLGDIIADARKAGLISWTAIEDRGRGIKPWLIEEDEQEVLNGIERQFALDYWERQNTYVEVWVEKDALSSVIERPCRRYRAPYMPCKGYLSASEAWRSGQRFRKAYEDGRRCVLIHLGDHDPSGIDMTRDNGDRVTVFSHHSEVEVRRIALNMDQIEEFNPPPNPAKVTDSRAADYIERFGDTSWELDALEPSELDRLISNELLSLIDPDIWEDTEREEEERRQVLAALHGRFDEIKDFLQREP